MLSLTTHEPHFSLLREEVLTKTSKRDSGSTTFQLLHISLLRQYLQLEFDTPTNPPSTTTVPSLTSSTSLTKSTWDIERIIDDFVLICFFIGNDFLPNLPGIDIAEGSLNRMLELYKELLPSILVFLQLIIFHRNESAIFN
jgi:5'-3' exoribonuclease 1